MATMLVKASKVQEETKKTFMNACVGMRAQTAGKGI
jgi:hypothetical protein